MPVIALFAQTAPPAAEPAYPYVKTEVMIPMRDGAKLYTAIYAPKTPTGKSPILIQRTPYGAGPYGPNRFPTRLGPSVQFQQAGYILVTQDIRGRWMSEGTHIYNPPPIQNKKGTEHDESSDAYDSVDWLVKNVANNNGRVGFIGISQPGLYAGYSLLSAHPAVKAVSPQAPVTDRFRGDDDHHNGAFFLAQRFSVLSSFGVQRPVPTSKPSPGFRMPYADAYRFFLELGPIPNYQNIFRWGNLYWNHEIEHPNFDAFWRVRGMEQYYPSAKGPAVLTVGGFYDAEDLYGALHTYQALEKSPGLTSTLVMGPWSHGQWAGGDALRLGALEFGSKTGPFFREKIQFPFFEQYLRDGVDAKLPEAYAFESGANIWHSFTEWPPKQVLPMTLYLQSGGRVSSESPKVSEPITFDSYVSDPRRPVPHTAEPSASVNPAFMVENQCFAWSRPDVLSYQTEPLKNDLTLAGPIQARLKIRSTGTDADFIMKVIDVYPDNAPLNENVTPPVRMAGYQMLIRWEVMRARFRNSLSKPEPLVPGRVTPVPIELNDLFHTFKKGHRLMVQIQSTMFPMIDLNPQTFVPNIYRAELADFKPAKQEVLVGGSAGSTLKVLVLPLPSGESK